MASEGGPDGKVNDERVSMQDILHGGASGHSRRSRYRVSVRSPLGISTAR
jgi:hypothetical protein